MSKSPLWIGVACAAAATGLGLAHLAAAGAPRVYLVVNAAALVLGLTVVALANSARRPFHLPPGVTLILGAMLLATARFGVSVDGASRWFRVGSLTLQLSLIVVPVMAVAFARRRDAVATLGIALAAVALALQPDRAMAGALAAGLAVLWVHQRDRWAASALWVAVASFVVTLLRPDTLPAAPYVERVLYTAFEVHALAGLAVLSGALLLVLPALTGRRLDPENGAAYAVFGVVWLSTMIAAALGNYPTPLVGYGGSAVLGYALSLVFMPGRSRSAAAAGSRAGQPPRMADDHDPGLRIVPAR